MRVPLSWLVEFIEIKASPEEVAEIFTLGGVEVEEVFDPYEELGEIITVEIVEVNELPELKGLAICRVSDGKEFYTVITTAKNQVKKALTSLGLEIELAKNGLEALKRLKEIAEEYGDVTNRVGVLVSDIEMPEMDGYTLTAEIKNTPELQKLHVVLHTSLSGVFNQAMVQKVGADDFIAKFHPDELATAVQKWLMTECE